MSKKLFDPRVLVLNHFAKPRSQAGGTRHVELFSRVVGWDYLIIAASKAQPGSGTVTAEPGFLPVPTIGYSSNDWRRVLNWLSYSVSAMWSGLRQRRVDVIYASSPHLLTGLVGLVLAKVRRVPFVLEIRDLWPHILVHMGQMSESNAVYRALVVLEEFLYRYAARIVVMAPGVEAELLERGVPSEKLLYIPNGADPDDFEPSRERLELREKYGFSRLTAVYAGAHGPANGLDQLLDAAGEVRDSAVDIVLVGSGVSKEKLMKKAARMGLTNVRFMDPIPKSEIPDILHAADFGLHVLADVELFRTAVSPNKLFDYMGAGLPVLTNCPGLVANWVRAAGCGFSVTPGGLAEGLQRIAALDEGERVTKGHSGRNWLRDNQSRSAMAGRLGDMLADVRAPESTY